MWTFFAGISYHFLPRYWKTQLIWDFLNDYCRSHFTNHFVAITSRWQNMLSYIFTILKCSIVNIINFLPEWFYIAVTLFFLWKWNFWNNNFYSSKYLVESKILRKQLLSLFYPQGRLFFFVFKTGTLKTIIFFTLLKELYCTFSK